MTEKLTVENGRLKVDRAEGKESLDLDLSEVDAVRFEASQFEAYSGALVLVVDGQEKVVRVDNEDAPEILAKLQPAEARDQRETSGQVNESQEPKDAPASDEAPTADDSTNRTRSRKAR